MKAKKEMDDKIKHGNPLSGIRVLDFTRVLVGPYCAMMLLDMGAEVIKIEMPGRGDDSRAFGPFVNGQSLYFASVNRGKKSLSLNLKTAQGKEILKALIAKSDVIIENFRPGTMEKLEIGYETLKKVNPRIIYAAASGFGHTGPDSQKPAYDILAQARGGVMSITGWESAPPVRVGLSFGDLAAALFTSYGISTALYQREKTGLGQKIDVAMLDCQIALLENALVRYQVENISPKPLGNRHPSITPFQAVKAKDRYFVIAVGNDSLWEKFCRAVGHTELLEDQRFKTNALRTEHIKELGAIIKEIFAAKTADKWLEIIDGAGVPCAPINDIEGIMNDKQIRQRNMLVDLMDPKLYLDSNSMTEPNSAQKRDPDIVSNMPSDLALHINKRIKLAGNPVKMGLHRDETTRDHVPDIGENNHEILADLLNYTKDEITSLEEKGVI